MTTFRVAGLDPSAAGAMEVFKPGLPPPMPPPCLSLPSGTELIALTRVFVQACLTNATSQRATTPAGLAARASISLRRRFVRSSNDVILPSLLHALTVAVKDRSLSQERTDQK